MFQPNNASIPAVVYSRSFGISSGIRLPNIAQRYLSSVVTDADEAGQLARSGRIRHASTKDPLSLGKRRSEMQRQAWISHKSRLLLWGEERHVIRIVHHRIRPLDTSYALPRPAGCRLCPTSRNRETKKKSRCRSRVPADLKPATNRMFVRLVGVLLEQAETSLCIYMPFRQNPRMSLLSPFPLQGPLPGLNAGGSEGIPQRRHSQTSSLSRQHHADMTNHTIIPSSSTNAKRTAATAAIAITAINTIAAPARPTTPAPAFTHHSIIVRY
ncbi:hypothetical protein MBM_05445 [Drepanopeziza brunnea f. sp. 'multigermtubi' MB_m1]|uniref:Uncharacterized protein n=1 Tax=Marssonina brunnea f. sp. multigermtubi (strain MB_m1) TaxID=1072389 RepID=K1WSZ2_MARBU|nr:uncharacterized protein MBM_05445 [Drepanopeziza brunnea f. sp. 'multigermtubi' MB_m1]EKD16151.1 hypothetical protein MBM_05445 [Drepanopeziza brunnea f. sp. 'multigermtubi' MB_m1]